MIQIPKRLKRDIIGRFSPEQAIKGTAHEVDGFKILVACPLCMTYKTTNCNACPMVAFANVVTTGCTRWLTINKINISIIDYPEQFVFWSLKNNRQARLELRKILKLFKEEIEWV
jgi:hypothetical protein